MIKCNLIKTLLAILITNQLCKRFSYLCKPLTGLFSLETIIYSKKYAAHIEGCINLSTF